MKKICWWWGTDALTLVKNPPGNKIWHLKLILYRLKWKLYQRLFDEHWVVHKRLEKYLREFGVKTKIIIKPMPAVYGKFDKKKHQGFNVLYYCPAKPVNLGGMKYIHWVYGYDIFLELQKRFKEVNYVHVSGGRDMSKIYPIIDFYIRPNRHDGMPRIVLECRRNKIPYYWSAKNPNVDKIINQIKCLKINSY